MSREGEAEGHSGDWLSAPAQLAQSAPLGTLEEQSEPYWRSREPEERQAYIQQLDGNYHAIVDDFLTLAGAAVDEFKAMGAQHLKVRRRMIWMTGAMAIANIVVSFAAAQSDKDFGHWAPTVKGASVVLPLGVAIYGAVLAVFSNLESLENYLQRAQASRQAREASVSAFRELEMLWHIYVRPFSDTPTACVNATNLYRRAVLKDQEVRGQLMAKTQPKKAD